MPIGATFSRGSVAMATRGRPHTRRLGHMQPAARRNPDAGDLVPAPQLVERDAEPVGDGDQGIAPAHRIHHAR